MTVSTYSCRARTVWFESHRFSFFSAICVENIKWKKTKWQSLNLWIQHMLCSMRQNGREKYDKLVCSNIFVRKSKWVYFVIDLKGERSAMSLWLLITSLIKKQGFGIWWKSLDFLCFHKSSLICCITLLLRPLKTILVAKCVLLYFTFQFSIPKIYKLDTRLLSIQNNKEQRDESRTTRPCTRYQFSSN